MWIAALAAGSGQHRSWQLGACQRVKFGFSKLLDARWAEIALAYLKDQDEYLVRRKNISRMAAPIPKSKDQEEDVDSERKKRQRAKAKAKAASSQNQQDA